MASRKFNFNHLTNEQLDLIAKQYPKAVETITTRRANYKIMSMLLECGASMPEGVNLQDMQEPEEPAGEADKPAFLKNK